LVGGGDWAGVFVMVAVGVKVGNIINGISLTCWYP
jgi:hypothetical protein